MVPPIVDRMAAIEVILPFEFTDHWSLADKLAPMKSPEQKIREEFPVVPIRSFAKFKPKKLELEFPDWLWDTVRIDWAKQDMFDVIEQRHVILKEELKKQRIQQEEDARREAAQAAFTAAAEVEELAAEPEGGSEEEPPADTTQMPALEDAPGSEIAVAAAQVA